MRDIMGIVDHMLKTGLTPVGNSMDSVIDSVIDSLGSMFKPVSFEISGNKVKITPNTTSSKEYLNMLLTDNGKQECCNYNYVYLALDDPIYLQLVLKYS